MKATAASPDGTRRFRERHAGRLPVAHFRPGPGDLTVASLGLGTYLGNPDDETDAAYGAALAAALELGTNLVDTAPNYRAQRSERAIDLALVGMRRREHGEENLALARLPPASHDAYLRLFTEEV